MSGEIRVGERWKSEKFGYIATIVEWNLTGNRVTLQEVGKSTLLHVRLDTFPEYWEFVEEEKSKEERIRDAAPVMLEALQAWRSTEDLRNEINDLRPPRTTLDRLEAQRLRDEFIAIEGECRELLNTALAIALGEE